MAFANALREIEKIRDELVLSLRKAAMDCYSQAGDYESKYAFSSDYDKSFKQRYYSKAASYERSAEELGKLNLPANEAEIPSFVDALKSIVTHHQIPYPLEKQMNSIFQKMEKIADS